MKIYLTAVAFVAVLISGNVHAEAEITDLALDLYFGTQAQSTTEQPGEQDSRLEMAASN